MTTNRIFAKLRKRNLGQYVMLGFCIFLSVLLISSFCVMYFGPTVQNFLPQGGDTRKMAGLLMAVTAAGCSIFTIYASNLFFRYKSREYGIFLALGESKKRLKAILFKELILVCATAALLGLVLSLPASFLIWKIFESFLISTNEMTYQVGLTGLLAGAVFSLMLALLLGLAGRRFVNRSDIMDILKTQHTSEMVREIKPWTFPAGVVFTLLGLFLAMGLPTISANVFHYALPSAMNLFYVLALAGIYLIILSLVSQNRLRKNKDKFYKNLVSISLMRFTAKSAARSMCVIVLLLFSCLFAAFFGMLYMDSNKSTPKENSRQFTMHSPAKESQLTKEDILNTAQNHHMEVTDYAQDEGINLAITYDLTDLNDKNEFVRIRSDKKSSALFLGAKAFQNLSGRELIVEPGTYKTITTTNYKENIWNFVDGLSHVTNQDTQDTLALTFGGTVEFDTLSNLSDPYTYVLNDQDYTAIAQGLDAFYKENLISFNVKDYQASYDFAKDLLGQYVEHSTALSSHMGLYDLWAEKVAASENKTYVYGEEIPLSIEDSMLLDDWKYAPVFLIVNNQDFLQLICVYVMLCLYIFIISLTAIAIMSYVRSITMASDNQELFRNLEKLGADHAYQKRVLKKQMDKIFQYPVIIGCTLGFLYSFGISYFNDRRFTSNEINSLGILLGIVALILAILYGVYLAARKKSQNIVGI